MKGNREEVPMEDMFSMGPVEKFLKFKIFPFKLFLNVVILVLLLVYAFAYHVERNSYNINSRFGLASMFFSVADNSDVSLDIELNSIDDFVGFIQGVTNAYYTVPEDSVGVYMHYVMGANDPTPVPPILRIDIAQSFRQTGYSHTNTLYFNLTDDHPIGPFENISAYLPASVGKNCAPKRDARDNLYLPCRNSTVGDFIDMMTYASIQLSLRGIRVDPSADIASVVRWTILFEFELAYHHSVIKMHSTFEDVETQHPSTLPVVICAILIPLALWDIILRLRSFHRYHIYVTRYLPHWLSNLGNKNIDARHAAQSGSSWPIFATITDLLIIGFCIASFVNGFLFFGHVSVRTAETLLLGLSCMFSSFLLISHLQTAPKFYVLIKALSTAMPHLVLYFIGVLPIFIGYAVCGTCVFGGFTSTFSTLPNAMVTLFCVLNGDSLLQMFTTIDQTDFFPLRIFSRLYLVSFLGLFICNVLNIALAIVQDSYTHVKEVFEVCQFDSAKADAKLATGFAGKGKGGAGANGVGDGSSGVKPLTKKEIRTMIERIQEALGPDDMVIFDGNDRVE